MKKQKIILTITLILAMLLIQTSPILNKVKAETITGSEGNVSWTFDSDTGTLTFSGSGEITDSWKDDVTEYKTVVSTVVINDGITSIGDKAFYDCNYLTSITIPDSVTSIGAGAFYNCNYLKSITIPDSVTGIGAGAFCDCDSLTSIIVDSNNADYADIEGVLFNKDKTELISYPRGKKDASYTIPDSVTNIEDYAFFSCDNLTSITIPDSVTSIGSDAFSGSNTFFSINSTMCSSLLSSNSLTNIIVDSNNANYSDIEGVLFNKDKTELICYPARKKDTSYTIPDSVTSIGNFAFWKCDNLTSITIPDSVTSITGVGINCDNLTIYCQSNSTAETYAIDNKIDYVIDDDAPTVKLALDNSYIVVTATDSVVGLADKAYSIDGTNWYESNKIAVDKSGEYTVYVRDKLGNTSQEKITVNSEETTITNTAVVGSNKDVTEEKQEEQITEEDNSQSKSKLPQTGGKSIIIGIIAILVCAGFFRRKMKKTGI